MEKQKNDRIKLLEAASVGYAHLQHNISHLSGVQGGSQRSGQGGSQGGNLSGKIYGSRIREQDYIAQDSGE